MRRACHHVHGATDNLHGTATHARVLHMERFPKTWYQGAKLCNTSARMSSQKYSVHTLRGFQVVSPFGMWSRTIKTANVLSRIRLSTFRQTLLNCGA